MSTRGEQPGRRHEVGGSISPPACVATPASAGIARSQTLRPRTAAATRKDRTRSLRYAREHLGFAVLTALAILAACAAMAGLALGPVAISPLELLAIAQIKLGLDPITEVTRVQEAVALNIRAPRVLMGLAAGAALGAAGAAMQGFFRNPLADPALIGVSAGGALAAVMVIVLGTTLLGTWVALAGPFALPIAAFLGSLAAVAFIYRVAQIEGRVLVATMLLAGIAANALASAGIGYLVFLADEQQIGLLTFWTLGSLGGATWGGSLPAIAVMIVAALGLCALARPLNVLLLGEADAVHMGVDVEAVKRWAALLTALGVGAATAMCGIIGFVGLVTPHLVRLMTGPDHRFVLPGSALLGGALLCSADLVARLSVAPAELPLGVVTALIGAPFFFWLLIRDKRRSRFG